ncbi:MAG: CheB methylesterase domain-containing protein [Methanomicrobiales archaeon]|nr:CheB methylesterase domain-containing protein [Methanomicrobiales archaeon]
MAQRAENLVVIGASTGGPLILDEIFKDLPSLNVAIIIVQHIPARFIESLRASIYHPGGMAVEVAEEGRPLMHGVTSIAPAGLHLIIDKAAVFHLDEGEKVNYVRPSIDVTMCAIAKGTFHSLTGIVLTGMGQDGTKGLAHIRAIGGGTIVQDPRTCPIRRMPQSAIDADVVDTILAPSRIRGWLTGRYALA